MAELLQTLLQRALTPLVPETAVAPAVASLTTPKLDQSPWMARLKGFGAGALEGVREQTSPLNLISAAMIPSGARAGAGVMKGIARGGRSVLNVGGFLKPRPIGNGSIPSVWDGPKKQVSPLVFELQKRIVPSTRTLPKPTLPSEFTHTGNVRPNPDLAKIAYEGSKGAAGLSPTGAILEELKYLARK